MPNMIELITLAILINQILSENKEKTEEYWLKKRQAKKNRIRARWAKSYVRDIKRRYKKNSCTRTKGRQPKKRFIDQVEANQFIESEKIKNITKHYNLIAYQCNFCNFWHIGHNKNE